MDIKQLGVGAANSADVRRADKSAGSAPTAAPNAAAKAATPAPASDLELSPEARKVAALLGRLADIPAVDTAKVNRIKAAIDSGQYSVDADRVADKIVRFEQDLQERK